MINSTRYFLKHSFVFSAALLLLQSCGGGERTTPYNGAGSSSSSSVGPSVTVSRITADTSTSTTITRTEKQHMVMRDSTEYTAVTNLYVSSTLGTESFNNEQVVLIDMGQIDSCADHLNFSNITANEVGNESVKVTVTYTETSAPTTSCSSTVTRPYYFYRINSRRLVLFEEVVTN